MNGRQDEPSSEVCPLGHLPENKREETPAEPPRDLTLRPIKFLAALRRYILNASHMLEHWQAVALGTLALLAVYQ
ncbi:MAG: hypothetical protein WB919_11455, partial [Candidatus Sulfotelmatobacter sp.]